MSPARRELQAAAIALLASVAVGSALMLIVGVAPGRVWWAMLERTGTDPYLLGQVLYKATAIALCGYAVALALDARLFNIGAEGQLTAAVVASSVVGAGLPAGTPAIVAIPACLIAALAGGAAVGATMGVFKAQRGANEVITSIMLNALIAGLTLWLGNAVLFQRGTTTGAPIVAGAELPALGLSESAVNATLAIALVAGGVVWWLRARTTWGQTWRTVGRNPEAARTVGISVERTQLLVLAGSGALAGLAAANFVMGHKHAFEQGLGAGTGFLGLSAALLGRSHPVGVFASALLLGFLSTAGLAVGDLVPKELPEMMQGIVILAVAASAPTVTVATGVVGPVTAHWRNLLDSLAPDARRARTRRRWGIAALGIAVVVALLFVASPRLAHALVTPAFAMQVILIAVPYAFAALGGTVTERAGVVDLALEGKLLFGAFAAAAVGHATGSAYAGVAGGAAAGAAVAALQILFSLRLRADQVIVGVALNVLGLGGTRFLLQLVYHEGANSPPSPSFGDAVAGNPLVWLALVAAIAVPLAVERTRWGLRLRAAGDRPDALVAVGVSPTGARLQAALVGGALTGLGGAQLSLAVGGFSADVSAGRGYMAIVMVILAGWRPAWAALACVGVAFAEAVNIELQVTGVHFPRELAPLLPYLLTLAVLVVAGGRRPPPRSLGVT